MKKNNDYLVSSGNLFADIGASNAEERFAKLKLAIQINNLIQKKKLTQTAAAELLDIDQPKISALSTGKLSGFSLERLFRFLNILGQDITIKVTPKTRSKPKADVSVSIPKKIVPIPKQPTASNAARVQTRKK